MPKLYGILPYVLLDEPLVAAGVTFESHHAGLTRIREPGDIAKFRELNRMFVDELGRHSEISTWCLIEAVSGSMQSLEMAWLRLASGLQFALLDSRDLRTQHDAERVDAWLFAEAGKIPDGDGHIWRTISPFRREMWPGGPYARLYPRAPDIRFEFEYVVGRVRESLGRLVASDTPLIDLRRGQNATLDSLPFFLDACRSPSVSDVRTRILSLTAAFEILLGLSDIRRSKGDLLARRVEERLAPCFVGWRPDDLQRMLGNLRKFCLDFYDARSAIQHEGTTDPGQLTFLAKGSQARFIGFFWKARQVFVACVRARLGVMDPVELAWVLADLVSNEDRLKRIIAGLKCGEQKPAKDALMLCGELQKYPSPESLDLVLQAWHLLVKALKGQRGPISKAIRATLTEKDPFARARLFRRICEEGRPGLSSFDNLEKYRLRLAVAQFAEYAAYALSLPHRIRQPAQTGRPAIQ